MSETAPDDKKLRELVLYVSSRCEDDSSFGATKLNKILFFADFIAYGALGSSITGHEYQRLKNGPAPRRWLPVKAKMERDGDCVLQEREHFGFTQKRIVALRNPNLSLFSGPEIALIDRVIEQLADHNAASASDLSHEFIGWQLADDGETIPFETVYLSSAPLSEKQQEIAESIAASRSAGTDVHD